MAIIDTGFGPTGYIEGAQRDGVPILFLHGVGSDKSVWQPQIDHFGTSRRAIAMDYPGYGDSEFVQGATRDDYAAAAVALLDMLEIGKAHICGLSLGGVVAIAMHAAAPQRCASLIIADSFAVHPDGQAIYDRSVAASLDMAMGALAAARAPLLLGKDAGDALKQEVVATMSRIDPAAYRQGAAAVWLADQRGRAAGINVPTLMLCGSEDSITPPALSDELVKLIPGSTAEIIENSGHLANIEQPSAFNHAVDAFIRKVDAQ